MERDEIITVIEKKTSAIDRGEAVDIYEAIFGLIDTDQHTEEDVLADLRDCRERGDTRVVVDG